MLQTDQSSNPVLNSPAFRETIGGESRMSLNGTMNKGLILMLVLVVSSAISWNNNWGQHLTMVWGISLVSSLVIGFTIYSAPHLAQFLAPLYCAIKGLFVGALSQVAESILPGVVLNAVVLTFGIMFFMLFSYKNGWIRATPKLRKIVTVGIFGVLLLVLTQAILIFAFDSDLPRQFFSGPLGIGISLVIIGLASFCLVIDFDDIAVAIRSGAPKSAEWLGAFGLVVTLIWLYVQLIYLLIQLQSDD